MARGWLSTKPEITPFEPDLVNSSVGRCLESAESLLVDDGPFPSGNGFFVRLAAVIICERRR